MRRKLSYLLVTALILMSSNFSGMMEILYAAEIEKDYRHSFSSEQEVGAGQNLYNQLECGSGQNSYAPLEAGTGQNSYIQFDESGRIHYVPLEESNGSSTEPPMTLNGEVLRDEFSDKIDPQPVGTGTIKPVSNLRWDGDTGVALFNIPEDNPSWSYTAYLYRSDQSNFIYAKAISHEQSDGTTGRIDLSSGFTENGTYSFEIRYDNAEHSSEICSDRSPAKDYELTERLPSPTNLHWGEGVYQGILYWDKVEGATGYYVLITFHNNNGTLMYIAEDLPSVYMTEEDASAFLASPHTSSPLHTALGSYYGDGSYSVSVRAYTKNITEHSTSTYADSPGSFTIIDFDAYTQRINEIKTAVQNAGEGADFAQIIMDGMKISNENDSEVFLYAMVKSSQVRAAVRELETEYKNKAHVSLSVQNNSSSQSVEFLGACLGMGNDVNAVIKAEDGTAIPISGYQNVHALKFSMLDTNNNFIPNTTNFPILATVSLSNDLKAEGEYVAYAGYELYSSFDMAQSNQGTLTDSSNGLFSIGLQRYQIDNIQIYLGALIAPEIAVDPFYVGSNRISIKDSDNISLQLLNPVYTVNGRNISKEQLPALMPGQKIKATGQVEKNSRTFNKTIEVTVQKRPYGFYIHGWSYKGQPLDGDLDVTVNLNSSGLNGYSSGRGSIRVSGISFDNIPKLSPNYTLTNVGRRKIDTSREGTYYLTYGSDFTLSFPAGDSPDFDQYFVYDSSLNGGNYSVWNESWLGFTDWGDETGSYYRYFVNYRMARIGETPDSLRNRIRSQLVYIENKKIIKRASANSNIEIKFYEKETVSGNYEEIREQYGQDAIMWGTSSGDYVIRKEIQPDEEADFFQNADLNTTVLFSVKWTDPSFMGGKCLSDTKTLGFTEKVYTIKVNPFEAICSATGGVNEKKMKNWVRRNISICINEGFEDSETISYKDFEAKNAKFGLSFYDDKWNSLHGTELSDYLYGKRPGDRLFFGIRYFDPWLVEKGEQIDSWNSMITRMSSLNLVQWSGSADAEKEREELKAAMDTKDASELSEDIGNSIGELMKLMDILKSSQNEEEALEQALEAMEEQTENLKASLTATNSGAALTDENFKITEQIGALEEAYIESMGASSKVENNNNSTPNITITGGALNAGKGQQAVLTVGGEKDSKKVEEATKDCSNKTTFSIDILSASRVNVNRETGHKELAFPIIVEVGRPDWVTEENKKDVEVFHFNNDGTHEAYKPGITEEKIVFGVNRLSDFAIVEVPSKEGNPDNTPDDNSKKNADGNGMKTVTFENTFGTGGHTISVNYTESVSFDGRKKVQKAGNAKKDTKASKGASPIIDISVFIDGNQVDGKHLKFKFKDNKNAGEASFTFTLDKKFFGTEKEDAKKFTSDLKAYFKTSPKALSFQILPVDLNIAENRTQVNIDGKIKVKREDTVIKNISKLFFRYVFTDVTAGKNTKDMQMKYDKTGGNKKKDFTAEISDNSILIINGQGNYTGSMTLPLKD